MSTPSSPVVMKFGGTSVQDADAFSRVGTIVAGEASRPAVVVTSAMSGVTDALLGCGRAATAGALDTALADVDTLLDRHRVVAKALLDADAAARVEERLREAGHALAKLLGVVAEHPGVRRPLQDEIVSFGERLSSRPRPQTLAAAGLPAVHVDARRCVRTDESYTRAEPLRHETEECTRAELLPLLAEGRIPVLGGFISSTMEGATTTLGRGGSDYTAAILGAAVGAEEVQIWTDVSGFLTADPRVVPHARNIGRLSYSEAAELAFFGAKVLHPKTIQPAVEREIPVRICNSRHPGSGETLIDASAVSSPEVVKAIAHKAGVTVVKITSAGMLGTYGFLAAIFGVFARHRTAVDIVATSEVSVSLTVDDAEHLPAILRELEEHARVEVEQDLAIVCIVGEGLRTSRGIAGRVFGALSDVSIAMISQGASRINLTFVVPAAEARGVVGRLHETFFGE